MDFQFLYFQPCIVFLRQQYILQKNIRGQMKNGCPHLLYENQENHFAYKIGATFVGRIEYGLRHRHQIVS